MLLILSCSETKRAPAGRSAPFAQVYDGPLWRQVRAAGFPLSRVAAISAQYGFLDPAEWSEIEVYDVRMDEKRCDRIIEQGNHVARLAAAIEREGGAYMFGGELYRQIVQAAIRYRPELAGMVTFARGSFLAQRRELGELLARGAQFAILAPRNVDEKTIAERAWQAPKLAPKPQQPCDHGLFSDDSKQTELF